MEEVEKVLEELAVVDVANMPMTNKAKPIRTQDQRKGEEEAAQEEEEEEEEVELDARLQQRLDAIRSWVQVYKKLGCVQASSYSANEAIS